MSIFRARNTFRAMTLIIHIGKMPLRLHSPQRKRHHFKQKHNMAFIKCRAGQHTCTNVIILAHHMRNYFCKIITFLFSNEKVCLYRNVNAMFQRGSFCMSKLEHYKLPSYKVTLVACTLFLFVPAGV